MKQALTLGLVMIALMAFNPFLYAQNKIGYVNINEVVQLLPEYKKATAEMVQYDSTLKIEYEETYMELNRQDSLFKLDSTKYTPAQKTAKREMMRKLLLELQGFDQSYQQKLQQKQEELMAPIAQRANQLIKDVATANGFNYILNKEALLVQPDGDDLLPLIKKKLAGATPPKPAAK